MNKPPGIIGWSLAILCIVWMAWITGISVIALVKYFTEG